MQDPSAIDPMDKETLFIRAKFAAILLVAIIATLFFMKHNALFSVKDARIPTKNTSSEFKDPTPGDFTDFPKDVPSPIKEPDKKQPTVDEITESRAEILRMQKALAGNMFVPGIGESEEEHENRRKACIQILSTGNRIAKNAGTTEDKKRYYHFKIQMAQDKIALAKYMIQRAEELERETRTEYLSAEDAQDGYNTIKELEAEVSTYRNLLNSID